VDRREVELLDRARLEALAAAALKDLSPGRRDGKPAL
jgi:hypothetical protein